LRPEGAGDSPNHTGTVGCSGKARQQPPRAPPTPPTLKRDVCWSRKGILRPVLSAHTSPRPQGSRANSCAELEAISGEPGAIEEVANAHHDRAEPDLQVGQPGNPNANTPEGVAHGEPDPTTGEDTNTNANAPVHLEGMGPDVLLEEEGISGEVCASKRTEILKSSCKSLGSANLPRRRKWSSSPRHYHHHRDHRHHPHILRLLGRSARRSSTQGRREDGADLEPLPHNTPPPVEAAESPNRHPPEQTVFSCFFFF
jgi:hypothetical protein